MREVHALRYLMKVEKFSKRGTIVAAENTEVDKIYIIKEGEFEIVKTDMNKVFYNESTKNVGLVEFEG